MGTIFSVENTDGSTHQEVVEEYLPGKRIVIKLDDFSPPLSGMATHFVERWEFEGSGPECRLIRTFELYPRDRFSTLPLWILSWLLKKAVINHTARLTMKA